MVLVQKWPFFHLLILGNVDRKNVSYDILERTIAFLGYQIKKVQRGLSMVLVQKLAIFFIALFQVIQTRKMCFTIFQSEKTPFQAIKTRSSRSEKIASFQNLSVHGFGPKLAILFIFLFQAIQARKMCFTISQNGKTPFQAVKARS